MAVGVLVKEEIVAPEFIGIRGAKLRFNVL